MRLGKTISLSVGEGLGHASMNGPTMVYRGDWNPYYEYGYQNCVTYRNGIGKGLYIAGNFISAGSNSPIENSNWTKIADIKNHGIVIEFS
jgi:hypothetical protein